MRPRGLLFDWDNTLVDTWPSIHDALTETFTAMDRTPWTFEETKARVRSSARESFPAVFGDRAAAAAEVFFRAFEANHLQALQEAPGASDMLSRLTGRGLFLGVVSNKQGYLLRREVQHLGWTEFFGSVVGADDAERDKPAVEAVDLALAGSGLEAGQDIWFVGDTDIDMLCAVNAGCVPVLLRCDGPAESEFPAAPPVLHFESCAGLVERVLAS